MVTKAKHPQINTPNTSELKARIEHHLAHTLGDITMNNKINKQSNDTKNAYWQATALAVNEIIIEKLNQSKLRQTKSENKSVNYLSLEYLMGRLLSNNLHNLDLYQTTEKVLKSLGFELSDLCEHRSILRYF